MRAFDFSPYFRSTVGFDHLFDMLDELSDNSQSYPPYNIERGDENHYRVTLAVAGFGEKDLSIEVRDGVLSVSGKHDETQKQSFLYQGIAGRAFERRVRLAGEGDGEGGRVRKEAPSVELERSGPEEE